MLLLFFNGVDGCCGSGRLIFMSAAAMKMLFWVVLREWCGVTPSGLRVSLFGRLTARAHGSIYGSCAVVIRDLVHIQGRASVIRLAKQGCAKDTEKSRERETGSTLRCVVYWRGMPAVEGNWSICSPKDHLWWPDHPVLWRFHLSPLISLLLLSHLGVSFMQTRRVYCSYFK